MMPKKVLTATQTDADIANALDAPVAGVHFGGGIHVTIPPDFVARILAGQDVPGCSYHRLEPVYAPQQMDASGKSVGPPSAQIDIALVISNAAQANVNIPAKVLTLTPAQQTACPALKTKIVSGVDVQ